ncbi:hypothetical protein N7462_008934 [Penicillium macrosclerotiorum]|uniref:uncharacterized protein n=1 Tax=Penicillium macrosclerotiorum TaxID=303699 RepID=UPI002549AA0A|nr:uncharacterized protein N7462_008934 [Penicillium macrosclerotiorum]KAJ5676037.1 hypothetical protein N7462_008934 [Penicillium macrosclerotiorum]
MFSVSRMWTVVLLVASCCVLTSNAITYSPLNPPSYPLAVRSPYLSAWIPGSAVASLHSNNAQFWAGNKLIWSVIARVDGVAYNLFGVASPPSGTQSATVTGASYTSTHSTFTVTAGSREFTLDFFSPVSPKNYLRQSLPFSYLTVTLAAGDSSSVQIYSDIDASWTGQTSDSNWSYTTSGSTGVFKIESANAATYSENSNGQALWGSAVYATRPSNSSSLSNASGPSLTIREYFVNNGTLSGNHAGWTSNGNVGFAHDLGTTSAESAVTFAIGHVREESINFLGDAQTGYYRASYSDTVDAVVHFLDDYDDANAESATLDDLIQDTGTSSYGSNYSDILALSVRQVYGGIEVTIPNDSLDTSETRAFIKEISSDGNINTVDVIFATFPIFYILSPEIIKLLIAPVFEYMGSSAYTKAYAVHELGANYPNATGHPSDGEEMPIEESGNVIILTYAYQVATGNTDLATTYSAQLKQYANYLYQNGLYPTAQLSLNDALGELANQTNLAVKAATGLATYGALVGQSNYTTAGKAFADKIWTEHLGTDADGTRFLIQYGIQPWFLVYNHYPDLLFGLNVFPDDTYNATTDFYPTVRSTAGVPLDGSIGWGQTNWQSFVAATVSGDTRDILISDIHSYISNGLNTAPFCDRYWVKASDGYSAGEAYSFRARPTLGSHFALAAFLGANTWSS